MAAPSRWQREQGQGEPQVFPSCSCVCEQNGEQPAVLKQQQIHLLAE
ncbi:hypothetical protein [Acetobacter sicerae]|nr:hypothetical protein [Acetobacter sicerae]